MGNHFPHRLCLPIVNNAEEGHSDMGQMVLELEQNEHRGGQATEFVPGWVPRSVQNYIDHTEMGVPIRALARQQGCHASTILRQIRRVETLRDNPLVDGVLKHWGEHRLPRQIPRHRSQYWAQLMPRVPACPIWYS